jgi:two-component sensor histidine kinase
MALVHEKLYRSEDLSKLYLNDYINGLAADLIRSFRSERKVKFCPHLMKVLLGIDKAIPFGLILSELITNCIRHAFPGDGTGEIHVSLILVEDHLELTVRDNGIGMPEDVNIDNVRSTGLMLVKTLVNQLKGTLEINVSCGTEFKIGIDI